ncbi:hypothetical protein EBU71_19020, partial [bacterium]|nr:hypothetical protein [Candidatus Elulimicrobium humile]
DSAVKDIYQSDKNIHNYTSNSSMRQFLNEKDPEMFAHCLHPTAKGYEHIADVLHSIINEHFQGRA